MKALPPALALLAVLAAPAAAQVRPFVFGVVTGEPGPGGATEGRDWTAYYDAGYGERTADPMGYDGVEQGVGVQGRLGRGFTLVGRLALGVDGEATRSSQEAEVLRDLRGPESRFRVAVGLGGRREWTGEGSALARVCLGWSAGRTLVSGNVRLEKPFGRSRDALDVITTAGFLHDVGRGLRLGVEAVGEDLEGFWDEEEAEGGAKLYAGPAVHWASSEGRMWLSAGAGPVLYATRSGRASPAPRPLGANGNGFTVRVALGYRF